MPLLSVIIPIYNVAPYLDKCLTSVTQQDYPDIEILCIDDGSTDGSSVILDAWESKDSRVRIFHQENKGLSSARNVGLRKACGEYVTFVDSDDFVKQDIYTTTVPLFLSHQLDVLFFSFSTFPKNQLQTTGFPVNQVLDYSRLFGSNDTIQTRNSLCFSWRFIFKRSILADNNLLFEEQIRTGEDMIFNIDAICHSERIMVLDTPLYYYRTNNPHSLQSQKYKPNLEGSYTKMYSIKKRQIQEYHLGKNSTYPFDLARYTILVYLPLFIKNAYYSGIRIRYSNIKEILSLELFQDAFKTLGFKMTDLSIKEYLFYLALKFKIMPLVMFVYNRAYETRHQA